MKLGSLFDGSGGFPLAASLCGIEPVWASEIEPYPIRITKKNFPRMRHLGDIREIRGGETEPVDIITFGSPCQDLSVAGKRAGLAGERSGLFMEAIRIIWEMREATDGEYPTYIIWENVFGAFSANKGDDFRQVIEEIARIKDKSAAIPQPARGKWQSAGAVLGDGYSLAWRVLDAQYWGVPQRRRRIFLAADFAGGRAGEILFKREGQRGHTAPGGAERENTAGAVKGGIRAAGGKASAGAGSVSYAEECAPTLRAGMTGHVLCLHPKTTGTPGAGNRPAGQRNEADARVFGFRGFGDYAETGIAKSIMAQDDITTGDLVAGSNGRGTGDYVRRFTPLECCRLQGFPDWWCDGVEGSDSAQYRMWGNGVALPCVLYVMEGIAEAGV